MARWKLAASLLLSLLLMAALLGGCSHGKKNKNDPNLPDERSDPKAQMSQRESHHTPDKFENSEDPPLTAETRFAAGQLAEAQGDAARAIGQYLEALKLDPNHKGSLFHLGALYTQAKKYNDAVTMWQRYLKATNGAPAAYNNLAFSYEQAGRVDEAERAYRAGIEKDPSDAACRVNYGLLLARSGRLDDATAQLQAAVTPAEAQYNIGRVLEEQGKIEEAKARYRKALELDAKQRDARSRLANLK